MPWVYMLRCCDGSLYTGWTTDLERRVSEHNAGKASRYTRSRLPVQLAFSLELAEKSSARREEVRIKRLTRREKDALAGVPSATSGGRHRDVEG
ncbi:MAG: GIY-YIG nuclease family protein [Solirubrobacteraceae bacterium]